MPGKMAGVALPLLIVAYCLNAFGKDGAIFLVFSPAVCIAAIFEAVYRGKRLVLPVLCLALCLALFGAVVGLLVWD